MNSTSNSETAGLNLPSPMPEQAPQAAPAEASTAMPEAAPTAAESAPAATASSTAGLPPVTLPPALAAQAANAQTDATATTNAVVPNTADDGDLIEKEWVSKAKQIIERTREDPHEQSKELNVFKADYMKKRYNKTIKLSE